MTNKPIRLFKRQMDAWEFLHDDTTTEIAYGGGAGGGKSVLGSNWLATQIAKYPGSTRGIGRSELKKIKLSTLITFKKTLAEVGFQEGSYKYDDQKSIMTFTNGCMVVLMDLNENPSDPEFDRLGSTEYTGFFIDEAQEVSGKAKQIVTSRLRNLTGETYYYSNSKEECELWIKENKKGVLTYNEKLEEYQVVMWKKNKPKLLMTLNPGRNFIYTDFYKPWRDGGLLRHRAFVQSLPTDNPFLPQSYIDNLKNLDKVSRERLLYGNFDYVDDPGLLFDIDTISAIFTKVPKNPGLTYICVDAARQGKDSTEIGVWNGLHLEKFERIKKADLVTQKNIIEELINKYNVNIDNVIVDEVGVGGGLVDMLGCKGFIANAAPMHPFASKLLTYKKRNYQNLKTQAFFYLQKYIYDGKITIDADTKLKDDIIEELLFIRQVDLDNDNKIKLESKKDLKGKLGKSPDLADMISFRMWWLIKDHHYGVETPEDIIEPENKEELFIESLIRDLENETPELGLEPDTSVFD